MKLNSYRALPAEGSLIIIIMGLFMRNMKVKSAAFSW
jgi:hypothetical protein